MREICVLNGIDPLVERSRSGKGVHIWIFFDKPIAASLVRKFGFALLDKGAEQVNLKSFKYYDRMLPAQDSLSDNRSLGNLIALPLQGKALQDGNSAFIDGNWNACMEVRRMDRTRIDRRYKSRSSDTCDEDGKGI